MKPPTPSGDPGPASLAKRAYSRILKLQLLARHLVEGFSTGIHRSPQKGASVIFKQHRPYVSGDEVRRIDWQLFARSDRFYIREFEQETNLRATLLVDLSGSMSYAGARAPQSKADYARSLAMHLATLLIQQQDSVGLLTFDSKVRDHLRPSSRPNHLKLLAHTLERESPSGETSLGDVLTTAAPKLGRRGILILLSDCLDQLEHLFKAFSRLQSQHHEIVVFHILDRDELEFPFEGWTRFESLENSADHLETDPAALKRIYMENLAAFQTQLSAGCNRQKVQLCQALTDEPPEVVLARFLVRRPSRR